MRNSGLNGTLAHRHQREPRARRPRDPGERAHRRVGVASLDSAHLGLLDGCGRRELHLGQARRLACTRHGGANCPTRGHLIPALGAPHVVLRATDHAHVKAIAESGAALLGADLAGSTDLRERSEGLRLLADALERYAR